MKKVYILTVMWLGLSCNGTDDIFEENFTRGGFAQFTEDLETTRFNLLTFEEASFSAEVVDPNNNIISYSLALIYGEIVVDDFIVLNSFPGTIMFTGQEVLDALNLTITDLETSVSLEFVATITTPEGTFSGNRPDFDASTNSVVGGDTANEIFASAMRQAVNFSFSFFLPPPRKLRGTSFEEPFGNDEPYTKPGGVTENEILTNNPGERFVVYTAQGTGVDDEIGFTAEVFFVDGDSGFTSERIGVSTDTEAVGGAFADGVQGYQIEDVDGLFRLTFDTVPVDNTLNPSSGVQIQYYPIEADHESGDNLTITAEIERADGSMETLELLNISGTDIDNGLEERWNLADTGFLIDVVSYTLIVETNIDSGAEDVYFDQMLVYIPE
ncbi:MAG: hypothetical protein AAGA43_02410 [Bacteroidota bacterium]